MVVTLCNSERVACFQRSLTGYDFRPESENKWVRSDGVLEWIPEFVKDEDYGDTHIIELYGIYSHYRGDGNGSRILTCLLRSLNRANLICYGQPEPYTMGFNDKVTFGEAPKGGLNKRDLISWYLRHGFTIAKMKSVLGNTVIRYVPPEYKQEKIGND